MRCLWQDLRYGFRMLARNPGSTAVALLSLALGIGATTAIFSLFDTVWLRPLPYPHTDRLVAVSEVKLAEPDSGWGVALANYFDWKEQCTTFEHLSVIQRGWPLTFIGGGRPERTIVRQVTEGYFDILGGKPVHGRLFLPEEYGERAEGVEEGAEGGMVLSYGLWQRMFGGDPGILGKRFNLEERNWAVVGVMSPSFPTLYGDDIDLWMPVHWRGKNRGNRYFGVIGRLREGIDIRTAQAEMDVVSHSLAEQYQDQKGFGARVEPLRDYMFGGWGRRFVFFFIAVVLVLMIACANVANLVLVRAASREEEMAVRSSLGAGRPRLVRQLLSESALLAVLGAALGLLVAFVGVRLLVGINPDAVPRAGEIAINGRILGFTLLVAVLTSLLFGLAPALRASKPDLNESLKETGSRATAGIGGRRAHGALVTAEIALSLVLLIGAGLMIQSIWRLLHVSVGFNTENLITMNISLPMAQYLKFISGTFRRELLPRGRLVRDRVHQRLEALPGVSSASVAANPPLRGCLSRVASVGGQPLPTRSSNAPMVCLHPVTANYFETLQMPLLSGRGFAERDNANSPPVALVSESLASRYFPDEDPIGGVLNLVQLGMNFNPQPPVEIVGVLADVRQSLYRQPFPAVYVPYSQMPTQSEGGRSIAFTNISFVLRTAVDPKSLEPSMRRVVSEVADDVPVLNVQTMDEVRSLYTLQSRFYTWVLIVFAGVALLLAAVGVFGVMSYAVARRTHEIGIRMALGAQPRDVLKLVIRQGFLMTLIGLGIGLAAAFGLTRFLASLLYEVRPTEASAFAAASAVLCAVALVACLLPARRAANVSPNEALRHE